MYKMSIASMAFLGCVVVCGSYPGYREELQLQVDNEDNFDHLVVKKDRDKRNANHPPDNTEEFKPVEGSDQSVALLANDQDFLDNLKNVFGENKQTVVPSKLATFVFDDSNYNYTNENNTGINDRFQPFNIIMDKFKSFAPTTVETPIATDNNDLDTESKQFEDDLMQQVFGSPPLHNEYETETPPPMITQRKNEPVENTTDTDYRFTSATIIKESYNRMSTGGSSANIIWFYMYSISLFVLFV